MWRQQEREELRSTAINGFITDVPLFKYYNDAKFYSSEPRDKLAVRELFRMCLELKEENRYSLIIFAKDPNEIPYKKDTSRSSDKKSAREKHEFLRKFIEFEYDKDKLLFVSGSLEKRLAQSIKKIRKMHK
jgi:nicotinamide riboside kinase